MGIRIRKQRHARNFVVAEVGFWDCLQVNKLMRFLRIDDEKAGTYILKLRQLVLLEGDFDGTFEASADDLAAHVRYKGSSQRFLGALLKAAVIQPRKRSRQPDQWEYVGWRDSPTGRYQAIKEYDRARHQIRRAATKAAEEAKIREALEGSEPEKPREKRPKRGAVPAAEEGEKVLGRPTDNQQTDAKQSKAKKRKERSPLPPAGGPDAAPLAPGAKDALWAWLEDTYPKPEWPDRCRALWDALTDDDRDLIRQHVPKVILKRASQFQPGMLMYLQSRKWLEMRHHKAKAMKAVQPNGAQPAPKKVANGDHSTEDRNGFNTMARQRELKQKYTAEGLSGAALDKAIENQMAAELATYAKAN